MIKKKIVWAHFGYKRVCISLTSFINSGILLIMTGGTSTLIMFLSAFSYFYFILASFSAFAFSGFAFLSLIFTSLTCLAFSSDKRSFAFTSADIGFLGFGSVNFVGSISGILVL